MLFTVKHIGNCAGGILCHVRLAVNKTSARCYKCNSICIVKCSLRLSVISVWAIGDCLSLMYAGNCLSSLSSRKNEIVL
jgi:hypothetical protein